MKIERFKNVFKLRAYQKNHFVNLIEDISKIK